MSGESGGVQNWIVAVGRPCLALKADCTTYVCNACSCTRVRTQGLNQQVPKPAQIEMHRCRPNNASE